MLILAAAVSLGLLGAGCTTPGERPVAFEGRVYAMKDSCQRCGSPIGFDDVAFVCTHECTFCEHCTRELESVCPNCGGELKERPGRGALPPRRQG